MHKSPSPGSSDARPTCPAAIVIAGPTGSGKSALALSLAKRLNGVVINADSIQVYRDLPVLTAQPTEADRAEVDHRLYGFLASDRTCSAASWAKLAADEAARIVTEGRLPVFVGGTGLYLHALMQGLSPIPEISVDVRSATRALLAEIGSVAMHDRLRERDPATAARLHPHDRQRIARGWDLLEATGRGLADWQREPAVPYLDAKFCAFIALPEREGLYQACDRRFAMMIEQGALKEVERTLTQYKYENIADGAGRALGFAELTRHLAHKGSLEEAVAAAQQSTRNYAKRQYTWFRNQNRGGNIISPDAASMKFSERHTMEICQKIRNFLLTLSA